MKKTPFTLSIPWAILKWPAQDDIVFYKLLTLLS